MHKRSAAILPLLFFACGWQSTPPETPETPKEPASLPLTALLPVPPGEFDPSRMEVVPGGVRGEVLSDVATCGKCHQDIVKMWSTSAHSFSSLDNPIYRMAFERTRREVGKTESRFCSGCHDIPLLVDGALDKELATDDPRAHAGITCRACHSMSKVTLDGNASYTLTNEEIPLPSLGDPESIKRHVARVALPPLRTANLCASCHRAFLDEAKGNSHFLPGMDSFTPWSRSLYGGSETALIDTEDVKEKTCQGCHMPMEEVSQDAAATNGKVASHRFLGGHTWLAAMRGDQDTLSRVQSFLKTAAKLDITAMVSEDGTRHLPADGAPLTPGERVLLDVVIFNKGTGHFFPGGIQDVLDIWLEVEARDAKGTLIAQAGKEHESDIEDLDGHVLRVIMLGKEGQPLYTHETHDFMDLSYNSTLSPRNAIVIQYGLKLPDELPPEALPVKVVAKLRHRSRNLIIQKEACEDTLSPRGQGYSAGTVKYRGVYLDPCAPQPITDIASAEVLLGGEMPAGVDRSWARFYRHGLGLLHSLQEYVEDARPSLEAALAALGPKEHRERAIVMAAFAQLAIRQGLTEDAIDWLDKAEVEAPGHPALAMLRGDAYAPVWRWREAIPAYEAATRAAPRDPIAWLKLGVAAGSLDKASLALFASQSGLALEPRNPIMLRSQALALEYLGFPRASEALSSYLEHRAYDRGPTLRSQCSLNVENCALERQPVHVHEMKPPGAE